MTHPCRIPDPSPAAAKVDNSFCDLFAPFAGQIVAPTARTITQWKVGTMSSPNDVRLRNSTAPRPSSKVRRREAYGVDPAVAKNERLRLGVRSVDVARPEWLTRNV
jgi:hypothetical protein